MPTTRINYIELPAKDLDLVEDFYSKSFGWSFVDYGPEYRAFQDGSLDGGFFRADLQSKASAGAALVILYAEDLEGIQGIVQANGGTISKEIFSFPGGRRFHFLDPCGNELAIWSDK